MPVERGYFRGGSPHVRLQVAGLSDTVEILIDTGFDGDLMLPSDLVERLGCTRLGFVQGRTASGESIVLSVYEGIVEWLGRSESIDIYSSDGKTALAGMGLLSRGRLIVDAKREDVYIESS
ncbi:MAG: hypothetical protein HY608_11775 [Planctomycetes bacterium]|nr:hypothetical protein [Planctomycetota bacterium]